MSSITMERKQNSHHSHYAEWIDDGNDWFDDSISKIKGKNKTKVLSDKKI